jgi:perosamine synthetase
MPERSETITAISDDVESIALAPPNIGAAERQAVCDALASPWIVDGEPVESFEQAVGRHCGGRLAVATSSGTAALHLALLAAGIGPGDAVLMPALTFVAPANAVRYTGAVPLMLDVEPDYRQLDLELLAAWLRDRCERRDGDLVTKDARALRIAAVMPVDLLGHPTDIAALRAVLAPYEGNVTIVEDAAEALGAMSHDRPVGAASDVVCLSFNANKIVTAGGGGMVVCDHEKFAKRVRLLANQAKDGDGWEHSEVGFNYKLSSAHAALGLSQLGRLDEFVEAKRDNAERYRAGLEGLPGVALPDEAPWARSTFWLYAIEVDPDAFGMTAGQLAGALEGQGIHTRPMFTPLHLTKAHANSHAAECPVAERLGATGLALPSSTALEADQATRVIEAIRAAQRAAHAAA